MTRQQLTALNDSVQPLTARQLARVIQRGQLSDAECAQHPRTRIGYNELRGVAAVQSFKGYALVRYYHVHSTAILGRLASTSADEVMRIFYDEQGKRHIFARPCKPLMQICDAYYYDRPMTLRQEPRPYTREDTRINIRFDTILLSMPRHLAMRGYCTKVPTDAISALYTQQGETLCKQGQFRMLGYSVYHHLTDEVITALRICHRNHYYINDTRMYADHIQLLVDLGLDIHNAHYVCPSDLAHEHAMLNGRHLRELERRQVQNDKEKASAHEAAYAKRLHKYLGIVLRSHGIVIRPLQSVADFYDEGKAMHHCVFACGYYNKAGTLILSARDKDGNRLATIEIDLRKGRIVQCRGCCNSKPDHDTAIRSLIERNMSKIIHPNNNLKKAA